MSDAPASSVDLLVIGGGVNGAGIARDAAGRGLTVVMVEQGDLAIGTSSRSGKLVHGGLRYLEYYEFRLVREALIEREVLLNAAPHIIWPMRFVLPQGSGDRPAWLVRLGLFLYDHLGGREKLPGTRSIDLAREPEGRPLNERYRRGYEYSDCWVDDARLVSLNALDAAERGADVRTRTRFSGARRDHDRWVATLEDADTGVVTEVRAKAVVNAAGPWVSGIIDRVDGENSRRKVRLVKGSHLVCRKFWDGEQAYLIQNTDKRVIFVNPYEADMALIGTTDIPFDGEAADVAMDEAEVDYLLDVLARYFQKPPTRADIVHRFSGVRPLYDDEADNPSAVTRDYLLEIESESGATPLLNVFGGKITTYRKLAEHAMEKLAPYFDALGPAWTASAPLPGGDLPNADFDGFLADFRARFPWLTPTLAEHLARLYGSRAERVLGGAGSLDELGLRFSDTFYECEARYLIDHEWAREASDILERRTKHGLHLSAAERTAFTDWLNTLNRRAAGRQRTPASEILQA